MHQYDVEELFPEEGWREPGDDTSRLAVYILVAFGVVIGAVGAVYLGILSFDPARIQNEGGQSVQPWQPMLFGLFSLLSAAMTCGCVFMLAKESRHWNLRKLTAERVVAGMFLLAFAVAIIAFWTLQGGAGEAAPVSVIILIAAIGLFLVALFVGLCAAGWQALSHRPRRIGNGRVIAKYGVDDKLQRIENHPCPADDGLTAVVEIEFLTGELTAFRATSIAYDMAKVGAVGLVFGAGRRLRNFRPER